MTDKHRAELRRAVIRLFLTLVLLWPVFSSIPVVAQDLQAIARLNVAKSTVTDRLFGGVGITLSLSQPVPFRVFVLDAPKRLVIDFKGVFIDPVGHVWCWTWIRRWQLRQLKW
jgi:hypothetical protein